MAVIVAVIGAIVDTAVIGPIVDPAVIGVGSGTACRIPVAVGVQTPAPVA